MVKLKAVQNKKGALTVDKLPPKDDKLSIDLLIKQAEEIKKNLGGNKERRATKNRGYLKCRMIKGRPYWYRVHKVKENGKWKNKETYIGTRKPRE